MRLEQPISPRITKNAANKRGFTEPSLPLPRLSAKLASVIVPIVFATAALQAPPEIVRGSFGEPHIFANSLEKAFFYAGYSVAQDRLWQMDLSRRSARGRLAALLGAQAVNSDKDAIRFGYTDQEYQRLFEKLSAETKTIFQAYANGVNAWIDEAAQQKKLPQNYEGTKPEKWTVNDSLAIGVNLTRLFGKGGAGEIRNLLLYTYLKDKLGAETTKAVEDIAWMIDRSSPCTCDDADDPFKGVSPFEEPRPNSLAEHIKLLPKVNLFELLPGIRLEQQSAMKEIAAENAIPYKTGSYAMVVSPRKSAIGVPLLLNGPQMGFQTPSIVHQMSIDCPTYTAVGMDLPGLPGVLIGHTPKLAWGFTSGVADTDDIFFVKLNPSNAKQYELNGKTVDFETVDVPIQVKGSAPTSAAREMSVYGPVVIKSVGTGVAYCRKSTIWMAETEALDAIPKIARCAGISDAQKLAHGFNASLNFFVATTQGDIGWFFCGRVPLRSPNADPRLPIPGDGKHDWKGVLAPEKMPFVINPKKGWIANWNNKPVSWWPNFDTPVWGRFFRNEVINWVMGAPPFISSQGLENNARYIATHESEPAYFVAELLKAVVPKNETEKKAVAYLRNWDLNFMDGASAPLIYRHWFARLQEEIFLAKTGNFLSAATFAQVIQPTLVYNALEAKTRFDWLSGRTKTQILQTSLDKAIDGMTKDFGPDPAKWRYRASRLPFGGPSDALYSNRGTYIQVVELWPEPRGRFVAPPGIAEDPQSPHAFDQVALAANWAYYPMIWRKEDLQK